MTPLYQSKQSFWLPSRASRSGILVLLVILVATLSMPIETRAATPVWSFERIPTLSNATSSALNGIAAWSPTDVWAVGWASGTEGNASLVLHYNGTYWTRESTQNKSTSNTEFTSVAVVGPNDVWAVGYYLSISGSTQPLAEHYNGTTWSIVPTPSVGSQSNTEFLSVAAVNATDIWAVGYSTTGQGTIQTFTELYDGSIWQIVPSPDSAANTTNEFTGVSAAATNSIWAIGFEENRNTGQNDPIAEFWNGSTWQFEPIPTPNTAEPAQLNAVVSLSPTDVWSTGTYTNASTGNTDAFVEHWNGSAWGIVSESLGNAVEDNSASSITSLGHSNLAASQVAGQLSANQQSALGNDETIVAAGSSGTNTLVAEWNGQVFTTAPSLFSGSLVNDQITGISELQPSEEWVVGNGTATTGLNQGGSIGFIAHYGTPVATSPPSKAAVVEKKAPKTQGGKGGDVILLILLVVVFGGGWYVYTRWQNSEEEE